MKTIWEPTLLFCLSLGSMLVATGFWIYNKKANIVNAKIDNSIVMDDSYDLEKYKQQLRNKLIDPDTTYLDNSGNHLELSFIRRGEDLQQHWSPIKFDPYKPQVFKKKIKYLNAAGEEIVMKDGIWIIKGTYDPRAEEIELEKLAEIARDPMAGMRPQMRQDVVPSGLGTEKKGIVPKKAPWKQ